jgi:hypothetical protein
MVPVLSTIAVQPATREVGPVPGEANPPGVSKMGALFASVPPQTSDLMVSGPCRRRYRELNACP